MPIDNRASWIWIGIALFVAIVAIVSFSLTVLISNNNRNGTLNSVCNESNNCDEGLDCSDGYCKATIGNNCGNLSDCTAEATVCVNNICSNNGLGGPGDSPPCENGLFIRNGICVSHVGGICRNNTQCVVGSRCMDGICINYLGGIGEMAPCQDGLEISDGICKIPDGECCAQSYQCASGSICDITPSGNVTETGICTAVPKTGEICTPMENVCGAGDVCNRSEVINTFGDNLYPEITESIIDLTQIVSNYRDQDEILGEMSKSYSYDHRHPRDLGEVILLLQGGGFILSNKGRLKFVQSDIAMKKIISVRGNVYGISSGIAIASSDIEVPEEGILYRLKDEYRCSLKWRWEIQEWAPTNIIHLSVTNNQKYLWVQHMPVLNQSTSKGYLYGVEINEGAISLVLEQKSDMRDYAIRNYGNNMESYIQFSPKTGNATLYPRKLVLNDVFYGSLLLDGSLFKIGKDEKTKLKLTKMINSVGVYITNRLCQKDI